MKKEIKNKLTIEQEKRKILERERERKGERYANNSIKEVERDLLGQI